MCLVGLLHFFVLYFRRWQRAIFARYIVWGSDTLGDQPTNLGLPSFNALWSSICPLPPAQQMLSVSFFSLLLVCFWGRFRYCSGDVHSGTRTTATKETWGFYFSGHLNLVSIVKQLNATVPALSAATDILLTGSSAGGLFSFRLVSPLILGSLPSKLRRHCSPSGAS
jgi:hypothetical protein